MNFENKVVVITGGARGIGKGTADVFVKHGAKVVVIDIVKDAVDQAVADLGKASAGYVCDVTDLDAVNMVVASIKEDHGSIDVLINNAGITSDATLLKMSEDNFDKVIDVNLKGVYLMGQACARVMAEQGTGVILNTSSVVGVYGNFGQTNYAATKWGVIGMTKTWAKELGKKGIRVNAVAPGFIMTEMTQKMPEKVLAGMEGKSPLRKLGSVNDIAQAFLFLASENASFITGTVLSVDGGVVL